MAPKKLDASGENILSVKYVQGPTLKLRAKLSCCSTGRGQVNIEGVIGIARAFLCAGARAVLASLWQVKDEVHDMLLSASSTGEELGELLRPISWRWKISEKQRSLNLQGPGPQGPFTWVCNTLNISFRLLQSRELHVRVTTPNELRLIIFLWSDKQQRLKWRKIQEIASTKNMHLQRGDVVGACERKLDQSSSQGLLPYALDQVLGEGTHAWSSFSG